MAPPNGVNDSSRSVYGFVFYLVTLTIFVLYFVWAVVPDEWLHFIGWTYFPQKYWAIVGPLYAALVLIFMLLVYNCYSMWLTPSFSDLETITDNYTIPHNHHQSGHLSIPAVEDIPVTLVNKELYL